MGRRCCRRTTPRPRFPTPTARSQRAPAPPPRPCDDLAGVGPANAVQIIDYIALSGPIQDISELENISGIGGAYALAGLLLLLAARALREDLAAAGSTLGRPGA